MLDADHRVTPWPTAGRVLTVASSGRRAFWREMSCPRESARRPEEATVNVKPEVGKGVTL
jgi:hypothetical protein